MTITVVTGKVIDFYVGMSTTPGVNAVWFELDDNNWYGFPYTTGLESFQRALTNEISGYAHTGQAVRVIWDSTAPSYAAKGPTLPTTMRQICGIRLAPVS